METQERTVITVENTVNAPVEKVWEYWTKPEHITQWNNASDDWHTPHAENDLRPGGRFSVENGSQRTAVLVLISEESMMQSEKMNTSNTQWMMEET